MQRHEFMFNLQPIPLSSFCMWYVYTGGGGGGYKWGISDSRIRTHLILIDFYNKELKNIWSYGDNTWKLLVL